MIDVLELRCLILKRKVEKNDHMIYLSDYSRKYFDPVLNNPIPIAGHMLSLNNLKKMIGLINSYALKV